MSEIELRRQTCEGFGFDVGRKQSSPIDECFRAVAAFCEVRMWSEADSAGMLRHVFFGLPADVEAARCVKDLVVSAFETETTAFKGGALYAEAGGSERRAMVKSFQLGLGGGVSRKLHQTQERPRGRRVEIDRPRPDDRQTIDRRRGIGEARLFLPLQEVGAAKR